MINYETILSSYDDKLTLMQWLKKVEAALQDGAATAFEVVKRGNATIAFKITFADGSALESGDIVLQQGESVESGAIVNGHLILTLTNGDQLDCGSLFNGNVDINGQLLVRGDVWAQGDIDSDGKISAPEIVESMTGYSFSPDSEATSSGLVLEYASAVKNGNKLTFVISGNFTRTAAYTKTYFIAGRFNVPIAVYNKLVSNNLGAIDNRIVAFFQGTSNVKSIYGRVHKSAGGSTSGTITFTIYNADGLTLDTNYYFRYEITFLLSDNLL